MEGRYITVLFFIFAFSKKSCFMLLIYTPKITPRSKYVFHLFFQEIYQISFQITEDIEQFLQYNGPKLNYSNKRIGNELFVESCGLLQEKGIHQQEINVVGHAQEVSFFTTQDKDVFSFDAFSASFYLVSRYEEYMPFVKDAHQRFQAESALAYKHDFLQKPLINIWANQLVDRLKEDFPNLIIKSPNYRFISTIDVDNAFCFQEKGFVRTIGNLMNSMLSGQLKETKERILVLLGRKKDPYDTFDLQLELQEKYKLEVIYFILLGDYGINDKNISHLKRKFQLLIRRLSDYSTIGIHPSYGSNSKYHQLQKEISRLENITRKEVLKSRQHFLKLILPKTYQNLYDLGIQEDYTMGYASMVGFRASICTPFTFYNLDTESVLPIKVFPFALMDATFLYYLHYSPSQSLNVIKELVEEVKKVNGTFISLWHNDTFSNYHQWIGWQNTYEEMIKIAKHD